MRMCRRLGLTLPDREYDITPDSLKSYNSGTGGTYSAGRCGYHYTVDLKCRVHCRINFSVPRRLEHLDTVFAFTGPETYQQQESGIANYVKIGLFRGDMPETTAPYSGAAYRIVSYDVQQESYKVSRNFNEELPAGEYCICIWSESYDNQWRMLAGLTAARCTITGYTGDRT